MIRMLDAGESRLALLHRGEMILPVSEVKKLIQLANRENKELNVNIEISTSSPLDQEAIGKMADQLIEKMKRSRGISSV